MLPKRHPLLLRMPHLIVVALFVATLITVLTNGPTSERTGYMTIVTVIISLFSLPTIIINELALTKMRQGSFKNAENLLITSISLTLLSFHVTPLSLLILTSLDALISCRKIKYD